MGGVKKEEEYWLPKFKDRFVLTYEPEIEVNDFHVVKVRQCSETEIIWDRFKCFYKCFLWDSKIRQVMAETFFGSVEVFLMRQ